MAQQQHVLTATGHGRGQRWLLICALVLTGLSMRTAVTSVGAALDDLQAGLHASSGIAGVLTTLPVICFAAIGAATPRLSHRFGAHRLLVAALIAMTVGLAVRATATSVWEFLLLSVLALSGGATANVLMPTLVKRHFPDEIGRMTAVYTTALAVGTTAGAGLTLPFGSLGDGWRTGLGSWAVFSALAVLPWLPTLGHDRPDPSVPRGLGATDLARSRTAWALMIFFAFQSLQAYVAFGWFDKFLHTHGISSSTAGWMVAALTAMTIPVSIVVPQIPQRHHRALLAALTGCYAVAYTGMVVAPVGGAWAWMVLAGTGSGMFPMALLLIGLRSRTADTTAALSAFVQSLGYLIAGSGPLLVGVLYETTGSWGAPMVLLYVALAVAAGSGWRAIQPRYVDDDLAVPAPAAT